MVGASNYGRAPPRVPNCRKRADSRNCRMPLSLLAARFILVIPWVVCGSAWDSVQACAAFPIMVRPAPVPRRLLSAHGPPMNSGSCKLTHQRAARSAILFLRDLHVHRSSSVLKMLSCDVVEDHAGTHICCHHGHRPARAGARVRAGSTVSRL